MTAQARAIKHYLAAAGDAGLTASELVALLRRDRVQWQGADGRPLAFADPHYERVYAWLRGHEGRGVERGEKRPVMEGGQRWRNEREAQAA